MSILDFSPGDQTLTVSGDTPLLEVYGALPGGLFPPFPPVALPGGVGGLVARGGFGQNFFFAAEVLGVTFRAPSGRVVRAGGRTGKTVQGYDLTRPFVGSFGVLGEALEVTLRLRPGVSVRLSVMNSADVLAALERDDLDLGFVESPGPLGRLHGAVVARDELVVVVAPAHPWAARRRPVPVAELAATPLVTREPGSGTRATVDGLLAGFDRAAPLLECSSTGAVVASVVAGSGPAVVSSLAVETLRRAGVLVVVPVEGARFTRSLRAVWRPSERLRGPAGDFVLHAQGRPLPPESR